MSTAWHPDEHGGLGDRISAAYDEVDRTHRSLLLAWLAFGITFGLLRALTWSIQNDVGPFGDITIGGAHIHHYVWGILVLMGVGLFALVVDTPRYNPWLGTAYGIGCALIVDEWALLLELRDVYWSEEGRVSVDAAFLLIAVLGAYLSAATFWRRLTREVGHAVTHPHAHGAHGEHARVGRRKDSAPEE